LSLILITVYKKGIYHYILLNINAFIHITYSVQTDIISYNITRPDVFRWEAVSLSSEYSFNIPHSYSVLNQQLSSCDTPYSRLSNSYSLDSARKWFCVKNL